MKHFDIIIIGGGMVGTAMACALRSTSLNVALIDATPLTPSDDHRLIALNHSSICLFQNLNMWPAMAPHAAAIQEVHVSHRGHFGTTRLTAAELQLPTLGYVIPAKHINNALNEQLHDITVIRPATLKMISQDTDTASIMVDTPQGEKYFSAHIIIGADGTHSTVREQLHIATQKTDYEQSALVTTTTLNRPHRHVAYERFRDQGAIAMLPLVGEHTATIWTDSNENIARLLQLNDSEFLAQLQKEFGYRLGRLKAISKRYKYPLQMIQADQKVKGRVILIGNAAHTLHPIAAQGLNLALYEIAELRDYFTQHDLKETSLDDFATQQQKISTSLSHHLSWLFSHDFFIMNTLRQIGMVGLDLCHSLKEKFALRALGKTGKIPQLLKGRDHHETFGT